MVLGYNFFQKFKIFKQKNENFQFFFSKFSKKKQKKKLKADKTNIIQF